MVRSLAQIAESLISWASPLLLTVSVMGSARYLNGKLQSRIARRHDARQFRRPQLSSKLELSIEDLQSMNTPALDRQIKIATRLHLMDAAFSLWRQKYQLDREQSPPKPNGSVDLSDPKIFRDVVQKAMATVIFEQDNAHNGATFFRLKMAHPTSTDMDLQNAIKAAVKLDKDCMRHYSSSEAGIVSDIKMAIELARKENPGFSEETYAAQNANMRFDLR